MAVRGAVLQHEIPRQSRGRKRPLLGIGRMITRFGWGEAVTPVVYKNLLLLNWDQEENSRLICLNAKDGKVNWETPRDEKTSWNTPFVVEHKGRFNLNGKYELISQLPKGDEHDESVLRMTSASTTNQMLMDLVSVTEVHGFFEKVPTMSEIFISLVKGNAH